MMLDPEQADLAAAYPRPEPCNAPNPDYPGLTCNLTQHGPDARHYALGYTWPTDPEGIKP